MSTPSPLAGEGWGGGEVPLTIKAWAAVALGLGLMACAAPRSPERGAVSGSWNEAPATPKRVATAIIGELTGLGVSSSALAPAGGNEVLALVNSGLFGDDNLGVHHPQLAESVPTVENGQWKLFPDGSMELTWTIKPGVTWHDGTPLTTDDLLFSRQVLGDRELEIVHDPMFDAIESANAPNARTVVVRWRKPYLYSDTLFANSQILPKHLLQSAYLENKSTLFARPYWNTDYVGLGPFKLQEWAGGSGLTVTANPDYVRGRPKIDEIEVKFIKDQNTLIANILAGSVELTITRGLALESGIELRNRWDAGRIETGAANPLSIYGQFIEPLTPVMLEVAFRRALLHALDRQEMVNVFMYGLTTVADAPFLLPGQQEYRQVEPSMVRYGYDARRAAELIEGLGYRKGADGFYGDARGLLEVRVTANPTNEIQIQAMASVADYWQQAGVKVEQEQTTLARVREPQFLSGHPGYWLARQPTTVQNLHSAQAGLPENNFIGTNYNRYRNPELDALIERYLVTIPMPERMGYLSQITHLLTDQVVMMGLFYDIEVSAIGNRLRNVTGRTRGAGETWNAAQWEVA